MMLATRRWLPLGKKVFEDFVWCKEILGKEQRNEGDSGLVLWRREIILRLSTLNNLIKEAGIMEGGSSNW